MPFGTGTSKLGLLGGTRRARRPSPLGRLVRAALIAAALLMVATAAIAYSNNKLRKRKTYIVLAELTDVVHRFHDDFRRWPDSLGQLLDPPAGQRPYMRAIPNDGWGNRFRYEVVPEPPPGTFRLISGGPDGNPDTGDEIESL